MDIDTVFTRYCEFGRKQKVIVSVIAVYTAFLSLQQVLNVFVASVPNDYYCSEDANGKYLEKTQEHCISKKCSNYVFSGNYSTIVTEWQLVCEHNSKGGAVQSAYMFGVLWSSYFVGEIADRYGRRKILYISVLALYALSAASALVTDYNAYVLLRHFVGVFAAAFGLVSYVLAVEVCGSRIRGAIAVAMPTAFALGIVLLSLLAYLQPNWRLLTLYCSTPGLGFIFFYYYIPESPRWLYSQGHIQEAQQMLVNFTGQANHNIPIHEIKLKHYTASNESKGSVIELFLHKYLRIWTLVNIYVWCVNCLVYYGLILGAGNIGGSNLYVSVALSGVIEVPAYLLTYALLDSYGRRACMSISMLVCGVCCILILFLPASYIYTNMVLALMGKMMISMSFSIAYVYVTELYPTNLRNKAMGIANMAARVGGILSPLLVSLGAEYPLFDYTVYAVLCVTAGALTRLLPETAGRGMPENLDDIHRLAAGGGVVTGGGVVVGGGPRVVEVNSSRDIDGRVKPSALTMPQVRYEPLQNVEDDEVSCPPGSPNSPNKASSIDFKVQRSYSYKDK